MCMKPEELEPGKSYACKFQIKTYLDRNGKPRLLDDLPTALSDLQVGDWRSWGLISKRDTQNQLLEVEDQTVSRTWTLAWDAVWDIDVAEFKEEDQDD